MPTTEVVTLVPFALAGVMDSGSRVVLLVDGEAVETMVLAMLVGVVGTGAEWVCVTRYVVPFAVSGHNEVNVV